MNLRDRRVQYETAGLDRGDLADDPIVQFGRWYADAVSAAVVEPNAFTLST
ncbi:MAG: pyridoxamine 5'-phosphate oxidase, partial [Acidimicrobiia bacterium]|nr:pyridoxamine 5'-phosphate oxidase [Acidimicrobiia bacterium]